MLDKSGSSTQSEHEVDSHSDSESGSETSTESESSSQSTRKTETMSDSNLNSESDSGSDEEVLEFREMARAQRQVSREARLNTERNFEHYTRDSTTGFAESIESDMQQNRLNITRNRTGNEISINQIHIDNEGISIDGDGIISISGNGRDISISSSGRSTRIIRSGRNIHIENTRNSDMVAIRTTRVGYGGVILNYRYYFEILIRLER